MGTSARQRDRRRDARRRATQASLVGRHVDFLLSTPSRIFYQTHVFPTLRLQGRVHEVYVALVGATARRCRCCSTPSGAREGERDGVRLGAACRCASATSSRTRSSRPAQVAEASSRAKDQFLALVSHELRSPLAAILNWATILSQGASSMRPRSSAGSRRSSATRACSRGSSTTSSTRCASQTGKLRLELAELDARPILGNVLESVGPAARAKSIDLEGDLPPETLLRSSGPDRLQQVFWNIVQNAVKFTPSGGRVRATMRATRRVGRGRDQSTPAAASRRNSCRTCSSASGRSTPRRTVRRVALGLGMAITRTLVELHGGSISATSAGRGAGEHVHRAAAGAGGLAPRLRFSRLPARMTAAPMTVKTSKRSENTSHAAMRGKRDAQEIERHDGGGVRMPQCVRHAEMRVRAADRNHDDPRPDRDRRGLPHDCRRDAPITD